MKNYFSLSDTVKNLLRTPIFQKEPPGSLSPAVRGHSKSIERCDRLLRRLAQLMRNIAEHRSLAAIGLVELEVQLRREDHPAVVLHGVGLVPLADQRGKLDILDTAGHDVPADDEGVCRHLAALERTPLEAHGFALVVCRGLTEVAVPLGKVRVAYLDYRRVQVERQGILNIVIDDLAIGGFVCNVGAAGRSAHDL